MSRSGYGDDFDDDLELGRWRGMVASAIRGKRGRKLLTDLLAALDAMPEKELIAGELEQFSPKDGRVQVCALGALGHARGIDLSKIDPGEPCEVAAAFDIAECLAQEIVFMNDEYFDLHYVDNKRVAFTPEERWVKMRAWVAKLIPERTTGPEPKPGA